MKTGKLTFRPLQEKDLPLMHKWLNTPHVNEWWSLEGNHHPSPGEVTAHYSPRIAAEENVFCYIIGYNDEPVGMIQSYDLDREPEEKKAFGIEEKCTGIDIFIGEKDYVHKGLGSGIIQQFLKDIVFADPAVECAVIDPQAENKAAVRAYEKAGFKYFKTIWYEQDQ
jgi:RimJ/RimL family protein N-acetyltransferase